MKKTLFTALTLTAILLVGPVVGWADTIVFAPPDVQVVHLGPASIDLFSNGLNGAMLSGQHLSLDLTFGDDVFARVNAEGYGVGLNLFTNAVGFPGFIADGATGSVLGRFGPLGAFDVGLSESSDGSTSAGMPFITQTTINDVRGYHLELTLPNTGYTVTNARLRFSLRNGYSSVTFGTPAQLPEMPTLFLSVIPVAGILARKVLSKV